MNVYKITRWPTNFCTCIQNYNCIYMLMHTCASLFKKIFYVEKLMHKKASGFTVKNDP